MRKSVCCCALLTVSAALSLCVPSAAFAGEVFGLPRAVPTGPGTVEVITGATISRPPIPPPSPAPSVQPEGTGDLAGFPAIPPGAVVPVRPVPPAGYAATPGAPVAGRDILFVVSPSEVRAALARGIQMIFLDVRDTAVRDVEGHIAGDAQVPLNPAATFPARVRQVIPTTEHPVVVYCGDGVWSAQAADIMARMGYRVFLLGSYSLWMRG